MLWIFALGIITLAVTNKEFRKPLSVTVLVLGLAIGTVAAMDQYRAKRKTEEARVASASMPWCPKSEDPVADRMLDASIHGKSAPCRLK